MFKILFILFFLSNCAMDDSEIDVLRIENIKSDFSYRTNHEYNINEKDDIIKNVLNSIKYKSDEKFNDYWQLPHETIELGTGDCEDYAILIMYLYYVEFNFQSNLIIAIEEKGVHALIKIKNYYVNSTSGEKYEILPEKYRIMWSIPYGEMMWMTNNYHNRVGKYLVEQQ